MHERVKMFTFLSGHGETLVEPPHEGHMNQWLANIDGEIVEITQSESSGAGGDHHVTICVWYLPNAELHGRPESEVV